MAEITRRDLHIVRGDFYAHKIILPAADEDANAIDWTSATFSAQIRKYQDKTGSPLKTFNIDTANVDADPPYIVLSLDDSLTDDIPARARWDFQETRAGKPRTPIGGEVRCDKDTTR